MTTTQTPPAPPNPPVAPYRSTVVPPGRDGFPQLLRAEWTKLRTVRRWNLTLLGAVLLTILISLFAASSGKVETSGEKRGPAPTGPGGIQILDSFRYVHRSLPGDGTLTVRVDRLVGQGETRLSGWAKAGLLLKKSTAQGAPYAAVMVTPGHGVRFQHDFVHDTAGSEGDGVATARWLRLVRDGTRITGYESADGSGWQRVGSADVPGLDGTVQAGLFVTSPMVTRMERSFGAVSVDSRPARATAEFGQVAVSGTQGDWRHTGVGGRLPAGAGESEGAGTSTGTGGAFTVTGSGDIAPAVQDMDLGATSLSGTQLGLVLIAALGALFVTAEYRRGMIRTTFAASPRRGRVLVAKAAVVGAVTFVAGLVASVVSFVIGQPMLRANGHKPPQFAELHFTDGPVLRAVAGSGVLLALIAVLALGLGALLRRTAPAIATVVVLFVAPLVLVSILPLGLSRFLQQVTPVAGFAIQETRTRYGHVDSLCLPEDGCYPQGPWLGLGMLALYVAVVLALAVWRVRRRDV
ncbi:ABC transporter permease subunit [Streptomyces indicus]|uniref:ABC-type transport system involved in multi-copper enzyme maturation, permease component n=1 Tax=Streptomyces indicus TaxID=417292 RepID=A0A1G8V8M1_9ACTN|nr:ABC transporter permease subunit [Streptomyces indicus]SDJ62431.1 ABC-type transport system involved in multi-copper enzyme maturation, permease component [Streptomyces indicus]